ncbi:MAG: phosphoesterase [Gemmatimonadales bacterium]|nr:phosphoesterase [Gemmatimonadales bacterium]
MIRPNLVASASAVVALSLVAVGSAEAQSSRAWISGDHHIHSRWSVGWDTETDPPTPIKGGDAIYPIAMNATMARYYGLSWMVATDHGGPNHSKVNREQAYPELLLSRKAVPEVVQFYAMEFDTPGADHSSMIMPHTHDEAEKLEELESSFATRDAWPRDPTRNTEPKMIEALEHMRDMDEPPVVIAHHPSRSADSIGVYGLDAPAEFRKWNNTAPNVAIGMEGAPGHQAVVFRATGDSVTPGPRGAYGRQPTMGGFDQMTARLGGFWDSMLGEGRHWWITANSDSHVNWREGGADFWPGEYSKTYVYADRAHDDILDGIRGGRVFVTLGDLVSELWVTAEAGGAEAGIGGELEVSSGSDVQISVRVLDPAGENSHGDSPEVRRVDVIIGEVHGHLDDPTVDTNPTTAILQRFTSSEWSRDGDYIVVNVTIPNVDQDMYVRVRGTNGDELEPENDPPTEDPWDDLWFYSNPIFLTVR